MDPSTSLAINLVDIKRRALDKAVGKAIVSYYGDTADCAKPALGFNLLYRNQKGELDAVVELKDGRCAVAEVKKSAGLDTIDQLQRNAELFQLITIRKTTLLIGGTHFEFRKGNCHCRN